MTDPQLPPPPHAPATAHSVARHTLLNLLGTVLPLGAAVFAVPRVMAGLGLQRFGVLTLAISIVGYFGIFDLGLGRATTKCMAEALGRRDLPAAAEYFWTALCGNAVLGAIGGLILAGAAPFLTDHVLKVPPELVGEVTGAVRGIAMLIPLTILSSSLMGALEAQRRFDLANLLQAPAAVVVQLTPLVLLPWTSNIAVVVAGLVVVRAGLVMATFALCLYSLPALGADVHVTRGRLRELIQFGGWLTVTNVVAPVMMNGDRFVIGSILSLSAVAYYATPYDVVTRLSVIASSLSRSLFPVFGVGRAGEGGQFISIFVRGTRVLAVTIAAVALPFLALGPDLLRLWISPEFSRQATPVLVVLAIGVLINSVAFMPHTLVQGIGRPDLTAKFHVLELAFYIPVLVGLLLVLGVVGAALAFALRVSLDAVLLFGASRRLMDPHKRSTEWRQLNMIAPVLGPFVAAAAAVALLPLPLWERAVAAAVLEAALAGGVVWFLFDRAELNALWRIAGLAVRGSPSA